MKKLFTNLFSITSNTNIQPCIKGLVLMLLTLLVISALLNFNYINSNKKLIQHNEEIVKSNNFMLETLLKNDSIILEQHNIILQDSILTKPF